jgi:hypothetical protein
LAKESIIPLSKVAISSQDDKFFDWYL